jgi:hypothetical protein
VSKVKEVYRCDVCFKLFESTNGNPLYRMSLMKYYPNGSGTGSSVECCKSCSEDIQKKHDQLIEELRSKHQ